MSAVPVPVHQGVLATLTDTFLAPASALPAVRSRPARAWILLAVIAACSIASVFALMAGMRPVWIVEQQLLSVGDMPPDQLEQTRAALLEVAPWTAHLAALVNLIGLPLVCALMALVYFAGERMLARSRNGYGSWFAVSAWSMLPLALNALGLIALCALHSGGDLPLDLANYASLNNLVFGFAPGERWYALSSGANLFYLWCMALVAIAGRHGCALAWGPALLLASLPYLLVFGPWALLS
jgi:hypothetical protein